jgi:butyrate kinase
MTYLILVINPGGGSTKLALFEDENKVVEENVRHDPDILRSYKKILDQLDLRLKATLDFLKRNSVKIEDLSAIASRGGAFKPLEGGVYRITEKVVKDVLEGNVQTEHASNLGVLIAWKISEGKIPAFFADPVSVDEMIDEARPSGLPELPRRSLSHALNTRYVAHIAAANRGRRYEELNMIVAHLGTGITISAHRRGRMIDVNNANDGGPFSPQRTGSLPTTGLIELAYSGKYTKEELLRKTIREGGLLAYLGIDDIREVERRVEEGDKGADLIYRAMIYQIAKEIGAMACALDGKVDLIVITGGMAHSKKLTEMLMRKISWIAPTIILPGEREMEALAFHALRVLRGEVQPKKY